MPILQRETDLYPPGLLDAVGLPEAAGLSEATATALPAAPVSPETLDALESPGQWWAIYTLARQEKQLMRKLRALGIGYYGPLLPKRNRSPAGRVRTSYVPLFSNYVFMRGGEAQRHAAVSTGCVSRAIAVADAEQLVADLRQLRLLLASGADLTPEGRIPQGAMVRIKSGSFQGFEGLVLRREKESHLLVAVRFLQQGVSVLLDDCQLEVLSP